MCSDFCMSYLLLVLTLTSILSLVEGYATIECTTGNNCAFSGPSEINNIPVEYICSNKGDCQCKYVFSIYHCFVVIFSNEFFSNAPSCICANKGIYCNT
jgi:hypothetical protein